MHSHTPTIRLITHSWLQPLGYTKDVGGGYCCIFMYLAVSQMLICFWLAKIRANSFPVHIISKQEGRHLETKLASGVSRAEASYNCSYSLSDFPPKLLSLTLKAFFLLLSLAKRTPVCTALSILTWHCRTVNFVFVLSLSSLSDGLTGQAALACQLRLLTSDPGHSPKLLLRMLLYRDCHLPRILLENSCEFSFLVCMNQYST